MQSSGAPVFSILIPSWNNLPYLKCCIQSLQRHAAYPHQLLVHVNEGTDGTVAWLKEQGVAFTHSTENIGICRALNHLFEKAQADYILYMNDDMYACPGWDTALVQEIQKLDHHRFYFSATMIEPRDSGNPCVMVKDYGRDLETFDESRLLAEYAALSCTDWNGATWPPSLVHRRLWEAVGGYSEEFSPGLYSDPDFSMKLWQQGVRIFRGISASRVYHFQSKSLHRVKLNNGRRQFARKWGIPASYFRRDFLRTGTPYEGALSNPRGGLKKIWQRLRARFI